MVEGYRMARLTQMEDLRLQLYCMLKPHSDPKRFPASVEKFMPLESDKKVDTASFGKRAKEKMKEILEQRQKGTYKTKAGLNEFVEQLPDNKK